MVWKNERQRHAMSARGINTTKTNFMEAKELDSKARLKRIDAARSLAEHLKQTYPNLNISAHDHMGELIVYINLKPALAWQFDSEEEIQDTLNIHFSESPHAIDITKKDGKFVVNAIMLSSFFHPNNLEAILNDVKTANEKNEEMMMSTKGCQNPNVLVYQFGLFKYKGKTYRTEQEKENLRRKISQSVGGDIAESSEIMRRAVQQGSSEF